MKLLLAILLVIAPLTDLNEVARINKRKKAANEAYQAGNYELAAQHYRFLVDSLQVREESVLLNLANALFEMQDSANARGFYQSVLNEGTAKANKSVAYQQIGLMDYGAKKYEEALGQFKNALKNDPSNEDARYNYELLKKLIEEQEEQQQNQQDQNQENQDQQNEEQQQNEDQNQEKQDQQNQENQDQEQEQQDQEQQNQEQQDQEQQDQQNQEQQDQQQQDQEQQQQEEGEQQQPPEGEQSEEQPENIDPTTAEKLEEMNISEEKAKMILEALKNNEIQYIQQNKRKPTKRKKDGKPDW